MVTLNDFGKMVQTVWDELPHHFQKIELDAFVIMPNHLHGILVITDSLGATHASPLPTQPPRGPKPGSVGVVIGSFKSAATKEINKSRGTTGLPVWQRNYHEHIIRNENDLNRIREYIAFNPARWAEDEENPLNVKTSLKLTKP